MTLSEQKKRKIKTGNISLKGIFLLMWQMWSQLVSPLTPSPLSPPQLFPSSFENDFAVLLDCSTCQSLAASGIFGYPQSIIWLQLAWGAPALLLNIMERGLRESNMLLDISFKSFCRRCKSQAWLADLGMSHGSLFGFSLIISPNICYILHFFSFVCLTYSSFIST